MADVTQVNTVQDGGLTVSSNVMSEDQIRDSLAFDADAPVAATTEIDPDAAPATGDEQAPPAPTRNDDGTFAAAEPAAKSENPRKNPHARVKEATAEAAEAKRLAKEASDRAAALEAENAALRAAKTAPQPQARETIAAPATKPKYEDFAEQADPLDAYMEALADWKAEQKIAAYDQSREMRAVQASHVDRVRAYAADHPDIHDQIAKADAAVQSALGGWPQTVFDALVRSSRSAEIAHYLGSHPEECVQLARDFAEAPASAATAVRRVLEALVPQPSRTEPAARVTGPAAPARPRVAPEPIDPVRSGAPTTTDGPPGDDATAWEHAQYWNRKEREGRRRPA